jgi:hypothetical protein
MYGGIKAMGHNFKNIRKRPQTKTLLNYKKGKTGNPNKKVANPNKKNK